MILTETDYEEMWVNEDKFNQDIADIPPYHEYLQREVYQQDYLDLFTKKKGITYSRKLIDRKWYVDIDQSRVLRSLEIHHNDKFTLRIDKFYGLLVEYDHPFKNEGKSQREIKYLLIGESPFEKTVPLVGYGMIDNKNTYFYNILHTLSTSYIDEPKKAFGINSNSKSSSLVELADKGVVLLDLFPYAINYGNLPGLREAVIALALTQFNINIAVIGTGAYKCSKELRFSFLCNVGVTGHAEYIIENVNGGKGFVLLSHQRIKINQLSDYTWGVWTSVSGLVIPHPCLLPLIGNWHPINQNAMIAGVSGVLKATDFTKKNPKGMISKYKSIGKILPNGTPHHIPIRFSLDL